MTPRRQFILKIDAILPSHITRCYRPEEYSHTMFGNNCTHIVVLSPHICYANQEFLLPIQEVNHCHHKGVHISAT